MSIDPISAGPIGPVSAIGASPDAGSGLADVLRGLAGEVVGQVAGALRLIDGAPLGSPLGQGDIHGIARLADGIASRFPDASAADTGGLTRALEDFAGAVATDIAAFADGRTLDLAGDALAASLPQADGIAGAIRGIEQATTMLDAARR